MHLKNGGVRSGELHGWKSKPTTGVACCPTAPFPVLIQPNSSRKAAVNYFTSVRSICTRKSRHTKENVSVQFDYLDAQSV